MSRLDESDVRSLYRALGQQAERSAPRFDRTWRAAQARLRAREARRRSLPAPVAIAVLLAVAGAVLWSARDTSEERAQTLAQWRSPTAFLLSDPAAASLATLPRFESTRRKDEASR
jgi:type VI protein secretion system component VasF